MLVYNPANINNEQKNKIHRLAMSQIIPNTVKVMTMRHQLAVRLCGTADWWVGEENS